MAKRHLASNSDGRIARRLRLAYVAAASLLLHSLVIFAVYFSVDKDQSLRTYDQPIEISFQDALPEKNSDDSTLKIGKKSSVSAAGKPSIAQSPEVLTGGFRKQTLERFAQSSSGVLRPTLRAMGLRRDTVGHVRCNLQTQWIFMKPSPHFPFSWRFIRELIRR